MAQNADGEPIVIKKYANRRLYNTSTSAYVTLEDLHAMVCEGVDFAVFEAKSGDDITRSVLAQIIFEQESRGENLLPVDFLRQLIRFYGDNMQSLVPSYLQASMDAFVRQQDEIRERMTGAMGAGAATPLAFFEEQTKANMAMFQNAMRMFAPDIAPDAPSEPAAKAEEPGDINALRDDLEAMRKKLDALTRKD